MSYEDTESWSMPTPNAKKYALYITFKSNEAPWKTTYPSFLIHNDDDFVKWATSMRDMLPEYNIMMLLDGRPYAWPASENVNA